MDRLVPYAKNSRMHSPTQIRQISNSIKEFGFTIPILVDEAGMIICGHARIMAAKKLKLPEVPVMTAVGWSEAQKRAYVIADNKLALNSTFDSELLVQELGDIVSDGFALDLVGFSQAEMSALLNDPDLAPVVGEGSEGKPSTTSLEGDVWCLGRNHLSVEDGKGLELIDETVRHWQSISKKKAKLDGDGRTFDEISAARGQ